VAASYRDERSEAPAGDGYRESLADQKAETRRRVLAAARQVFLRDGFMETNLNEVARLAGVGKGTLYRHFENKAELYVAVLTENDGGFFEAACAAVDASAAVPEQLRQIADFYLDFWKRHPEGFRVIWAVQNRELIGGLSPALLERVATIFQRPVRFLERLVRTGIERGEIGPCDPWVAANAIVLSINAVVGRLVHGDHVMLDRDLEAVYRQTVDLLVQGLVATREVAEESAAAS
jgi:AcrR family transcriptional regulator